MLAVCVRVAACGFGVLKERRAFNFNWFSSVCTKITLHLKKKNETEF